MSHIRMTGPEDEREWHLREHITTPRPAWHERGLTRRNAPANPPGPNRQTDAHRKRSRKRYRGVRRVERAGRVKYEAQVCHDGRVHYAGTANTPAAAARLYDDYVRAHGLNKRLNFGDVEASVSNEYE